MNRFLLLPLLALLAFACGESAPSTPAASGTAPAQAAPAPNDGRGVGEITSVSLNSPLKPDMVERGTAIYEMKCAACHKLNSQRVVGPGWAGITSKRKPEWIKNMTTNVDVMLEQDPAARELLKECLVRMPNQNLSVGDARDVLEFMFANDGQPVAK